MKEEKTKKKESIILLYNYSLKGRLEPLGTQTFSQPVLPVMNFSLNIYSDIEI